MYCLNKYVLLGNVVFSIVCDFCCCATFYYYFVWVVYIDRFFSGAYDDGLAGIDPMESLPLRFDNPDLAMAMEVGDDEEDVYEHPLELKW